MSKTEQEVRDQIAKLRKARAQKVRTRSRLLERARKLGAQIQGIDPRIRKLRKQARKLHKLSNADRVSQAGLEFIASWEGFSPTAYRFPGETYLTIGFGHYGPDVQHGQTISKEAALKLLRKDAGVAEQAVKSLVKVGLTQNQFDALISFTYNCGTGALQSSTLLAKLNQGRHSEVPAELKKWVYGADGKLEGLVRRRAAEADLWRKG